MRRWAALAFMIGFSVTLLLPNGMAADEKYQIMVPINPMAVNTHWEHIGGPLPVARVGVPYTFNFMSYINPSTAKGINWLSDTLPPWASLSQAGVLSGTPALIDRKKTNHVVTAARAAEDPQVQTYQLEVANLALMLDKLSAGHYHTCGIKDGAARCWGNGAYGRLGNNATTNEATPKTVVGLTSNVTDIESGSESSCALAGGEVFCWGRNQRGQLGDGTTTTSLVPVKVMNLPPGIVQIAAGGWHTCALDSGGSLYCWGYNSNGQLGIGSLTTEHLPVQIPFDESVIQVTAGYSNTCAVLASGAAKCWGRNDLGAVGDETTIDRSTPVDVVGFGSQTSMIDLGANHACGINKGLAYCWGYNDNGQLGDGTFDNSSIPVEVEGLGSASLVTAGQKHSCGVNAKGAAFCWGTNSSYMLGNGNTTGATYTTPSPVVGFDNFVIYIDSGTAHTCGFTTDGSAKCWGLNSYYQLGTGNTYSFPYPQEVKPGS